MPQPTRYPPDDPREWLNRAHSNLARAHVTNGRTGIYAEDVCFDAQQATEKAIKAVLIFRQVDFPKTHDIAELLTLLSGDGLPAPPDVVAASALTQYAVLTRYPGPTGAVSEEDCEHAISRAETVVKWAEQIIAGKREERGSDPSRPPPQT